MLNEIVVASLIFTSEINAIRGANGLKPIYFVHNEVAYQYVVGCEDVRNDKISFVIVKDVKKSNDEVKKLAHKIKRIDETSTGTSLGLFFHGTREASAVVGRCGTGYLVAIAIKE